MTQPNMKPYEELATAIQAVGGFVQKMWAKDVVALMVEELLKLGHMRLSEDHEHGHPFFALLDVEGDTDYMPVTHEQHGAMVVLRDSTGERSKKGAKD